MLGGIRRWVWPPVYLLIVLLGALGFPHFSGARDLNSRLGAGEIITSVKNIDGTPLKRGEAIGVVDASPDKVWQVITDANHFSEFMPRTLKSRVVPPDKLEVLLQQKPTQPQEVEAILGPTPPDPALFQVPNQKYFMYLYSLLDFPWPLGNRWYVIKVMRDETKASQKIYISTWSLLLGNMRENRGEWRLEPFGDQKTKVYYKLIADSGVILPQFFIKRATNVTLPRLIDAVRKRVAQIPPQ